MGQRKPLDTHLSVVRVSVRAQLKVRCQRHHPVPSLSARSSRMRCPVCPRAPWTTSGTERMVGALPLRRSKDSCVMSLMIK